MSVDPLESLPVRRIRARIASAKRPVSAPSTIFRTPAPREDPVSTRQ